MIRRSRDNPWDDLLDHGWRRLTWERRMQELLLRIRGEKERGGWIPPRPPPTNACRGGGKFLKTENRFRTLDKKVVR